MLRTFHRWGGLVFIVYVFPVGRWLGFFPIGWVLLTFVGIGFGKGYRKSSLFEIIFLSYWGGSGLICRMSCYIMNYFTFLAGEI